MSRIRILVSMLLCAPLLLLSEHSQACRPKFNSVAAYAQNQIPYHAIFLGKVVAANQVQQGNGTATYNIQFKPIRWLGGKEQSMVVVRGVKGSYLGTDCEGQLDFFAESGEEWVIFGQYVEGKVTPDVFLSRKVVNGNLPAELLAELTKEGIGL